MSFMWKILTWEDLSRDELYALLRLRAEVFVVEQDCPYQDLDGKDDTGHHLWAEDNQGIAGYLRILPPGVSYEESSIGRVVTTDRVRRMGVGKELMRRGIAAAQQMYPDSEIHISAQKYLFDFYTSFGFEQVGEEYLEDGIPHIGMIRKRDDNKA
jgi:ElaA protein